MSRISVVVFAQAPPPEHGQSRMVQRAIESLSEYPDEFEVYHVDARFSETLDDIGESSLVKGLLIIKYVIIAVVLRFRLKSPLFYYVPGPVKRSSLIRDWVLLGVLRLLYKNIIFHWHAIGQGEWAHGSTRIKLSGPQWLDHFGRSLSRLVLSKPYASICVVESSARDAVAIESRRAMTICNGISDPCPDFDSSIRPRREIELSEIAASARPCFRILYLSHGTIEKGLFDAINAMERLVEFSSPDWQFKLTIAGGVRETLRGRFSEAIADLKKVGGARLEIDVRGYLQGEAKQNCFQEHDVFLAPSRWESFGLTVAEAMANGMQVVAVASDGVSGVLPAEHEFLSPVAAPDSLAENLRRCCEYILSGGGAQTAIGLRARFLERFQIEEFKGSLQCCFRQFGTKRLRKTGEMVDHQYGFEGGRIAGGKEGRNFDSVPDGRRERSARISIYLADQNPKLGRSLGISRMTHVVLGELARREGVELTGITSRSSIQMPEGTESIMVPWSTRSRATRVLTDHLHPLMRLKTSPDLWYFPKGFLPRVSSLNAPMVVTIHDTIIQYYCDHYPKWRTDVEYHYWASILKNTLRKATTVLTVSEAASEQIKNFMRRHELPEKEIIVTYEPCMYEAITQPVNPAKADYVLHLASREPHKRTSWLIGLWSKAYEQGISLPQLHVVGKVPYDVASLTAQCPLVVRLPFLDDDALVSQFKAAQALLLPSEIEGFGLPAIEAYYLGTPVCYVTGTSVEEVLAPATSKGGFHYDDEGSVFRALDSVRKMEAREIRECGLKLREEYAVERVVDRILEVFKRVGGDE